MVEPVPLNHGKRTAFSLGAGATDSDTIQCGGVSTLNVRVAQDAGASGDVTISILPFESDNTTIMPISVPPVSSVGPTLASGQTYFYAQYDVTAFSKIRFDVKNNNVGAQTVREKSWDLA